MFEWKDKYNPFNSDKILVWREWLEGCAKADFLPPITIDIDPSGRCNLNCIWCNFADYNKECSKDIPTEHLLRIADFAAAWGVKSVHVLGGGEPLMNPGVKDLFLHLQQNGLQSSLITNGTLLTDELIDVILKTCRWVGISLDAGSSDTYMKVKGIGSDAIFGLVTNNIKKLCDRKKELKSNCAVCAKYLMHPLNVKDIFKCALLVKYLGVDDFQIRPAGWENVQNKNVTKFDFTPLLDIVNEQIEKTRGIESDTFHTYGVRHKFSVDMERKITYSKCIASPVTLVFGADGNCHVCGDRRGQKEFILCSHYPDVRNVLKYWNTEWHHDIIKSVRLEECPRCVLGPYHEIIEKVFIKDQMCRYFP